MARKNITHLVLNSRDVKETGNFYENILGLSNRPPQDSFRSYQVGSFILNFNEIPELPTEARQAINHIGIELSSQREVDEMYDHIKSRLNSSLNEPKGGRGLGPYRFTVQDPNGYALEFETWEGCSD